MAAVVLFLMPGLLSLTAGQLRRTPGSDKYYHRLLVELIRANKHRPVSTHTNFVNGTVISYPQLMHWLLAFCGDRTFAWFSRNMPVLANVMLGSSCITFIHLLPSALGISLTPRQVLQAGLLYAFVPYTFSPNNAKNVGLSARGVGLLFGLWYTFALLAVHRRPDAYPWMIVAAVSAFLILFSSQFATQYLVLATPLLSWFMRDPLLLVFPLGGVLLFLLLFPRIALGSLKGQWGHKKLYFSELADRFILKHRYSIWRELVVEIPRLLINDVRRGHRPLNVLLVAFRRPFGNAVLVVLAEMAVVPLGCSAGWQGRARPDVLLLAAPVWTASTLFLLTSFRKTRFLGEPERYVEFALFFAAVVSAMVFPPSVTGALSAVSLLRLLLTSNAWRHLSVQVDGADGKTAIAEVKEFLLQHAGDGRPRLLCNSTEACSYLFDMRIQQYYYLVNSSKNDEFAFSEIYSEDYDYVSEHMLPVLMARYRLDFLVVDATMLKRTVGEVFAGRATPVEVFSRGRFIVYSIA